MTLPTPIQRATRAFGRLPERDRRALITLAFFVVALGYGLYLLDPLYTALQASRAQVVDTRDERDFTRRLRLEKDSRLAEVDRLQRRVGSLGSALAGPGTRLGPEASTAEWVGTIIDAAGLAGVQVEGITPEGDGDGEDATALRFSVDGTGSASTIAAFLDSLGGLRVDDLSLTGDGYGLRFLARLAPVDAEGRERVRALGADQLAVLPVQLVDDPFAARRPPPPVVEASPVEAVAPEPVLDLGGMELAGIIELGDRYMAAIIDRYENVSRFLIVGDEVRGYAVESVTESEVVLAGDGLTGSLRLPERPAPSNLLGDPDAAPAVDFSDLITWEAIPTDGPLVETGLLERAGARLGARLVAISADPVEPEGSESRAALYVTEVTSARTSIIAGDLIAMVNGVAVDELESALLTIIETTPGEPVVLEILREGQLSPVTVTAEEGRP